MNMNNKQIEVREMQFKTIPFDTLKEYNRNSLKESENRDVDKLKMSILNSKFSFPFFIWNKTLLDGDGRLLALFELAEEGYEIPDLPFVELQAKDLKEAKKLVLMASSQHGEITQQSFNLFTQDIDVPLLEVNIPYLNVNLEENESSAKTEENKAERASTSYKEVDADDAIEFGSDIETNIKEGDIIQLGRHRLFCGDSLRTENVNLLMNGDNADVLYCDPPYGMKLGTDFSRMGTSPNMLKKAREKKIKAVKAKNYKKVIGDDKPFDPSILLDYFDYCSAFLWGADYYADKLPLKEFSYIVWDKRGGNREFFWQTSEFELLYVNKKVHRRILEVMWSGFCGTQNERKEELGNGESGGKRCHPNQKPLLLHKCIFENYMTKYNLIVDLFLGSGSTLIAGEKYGKTVYGAEIDPQYCEIICQRWEKLTGQKRIINT